MQIVKAEYRHKDFPYGATHKVEQRESDKGWAVYEWRKMVDDIAYNWVCLEDGFETYIAAHEWLMSNERPWNEVTSE